MKVSEIQLFNILKERLGESEAQTLVEYVDHRVETEFDIKKDVLATKEDVYAVKEDIYAVKEDVANVKAELIKWMFVFWVGQLAAFIAIAKFLM